MLDGLGAASSGGFSGASVWYTVGFCPGLGGACHFGCLKGVSKAVQVLLNGIEPVMALTLIILK